MNKLCSASTVEQFKPSEPWETATSRGPETFEVNVIFTDPRATAAALHAAQSLARGLGAVIRLRAGIVVPVRLPLDQPLVSVQFVERLLRKLAEQLELADCEITVHLYVCRNWVETLLDVLRPGSLVVVGGRRRWWPSAASRVASALHAKGHRVTFVPAKGEAAESLR